ncbi:hypothetical protein BBBOND_0313370 [Babesia bigemina]|uniref:Uncharacterized protein n=1 Tax=Babesia bigemina TaxID=5866 RepID=A0A061DEK4_BABBI|nr:hypothetical protein BBBOND_0313370 [Babesia bigemina]CDR97435.1 hypothetical protein BBBOND_0313370 [Babesia bigemina]|eukprot:XP_012769621.1 hypothetical protein BBBOND_0313370 [Babesia bigemina]
MSLPCRPEYCQKACKIKNGRCECGCCDGENIDHVVIVSLPIIVFILFLLAVCIMSFFRIRPFHKVRDFCTGRMNSFHRNH